MSHILDPILAYGNMYQVVKYMMRFYWSSDYSHQLALPARIVEMTLWTCTLVVAGIAISRSRRAYRQRNFFEYQLYHSLWHYIPNLVAIITLLFFHQC